MHRKRISTLITPRAASNAMSSATSETAPKVTPKAVPIALAGTCLSIPISLAFLALHPTPTFADSPLTQSSVALSITSDNDDAYLAPTSSTTSEAHSYNMVTITMENTSSYSLYASASGTDANSQPTANLVNLSPTFSPAQNLTTVITPVASTQTMSTMSNNTWGYRIKQSASATIDPASTFLSTDPYSAITTTSTNITGNAADRITDESSRYWLLDFGTKVDDTLAGGNYTNTITLSALATPIISQTYTITYNLNGGENGPSSPDTVTLDEDNPQYTISSTIPTRNGYNFAGWNDGTNTYQASDTITLASTSTTLTATWTINKITITYNLNGGTGCGTTTEEVTPGASFTPSVCTAPTKSGKKFVGWNTSSSATTALSFPQTYNANTTLYAVWADTFQTFTRANCNAINFGQTINLKDSRDNKSYLVTKLKMSSSDTTGTCWMAQNLAIAPGTSLTPSNSNVSSSYTIPTSTSFSSNTGQDAIVPNHVDNTVDNKDTNKGGFYTWGTATAGTFASTYDICPKGWRLPTGNTGEFYALYQAYGGSDTSGTNAELQKYFWGTAGTSATLSSVLAGHYYNGSAGSAGSYGGWWSSTPNGTTNAYRLDVNASNSGFYPQYGYNRYGGYSIRCLFAS